MSKLLFILCFLFSTTTFSNTLTINSLKSFSHKLINEVAHDPEMFFGYLSEDLVVESKIGDDIQGFTIFYNKQEYVALLKPSFSDEQVSESNIDIFGYKLISSNLGEFTIKKYSELIQKYIWTIYTVDFSGDETKIIKVAESI